MQESFNRLIREIMLTISPPQNSPVYTGFFASSWKASGNKIDPIDATERTLA